MVVWVVKFPSERYKIRKIFGQKSTYPEIIIVVCKHIVPIRQKLGIILGKIISRGCIPVLETCQTILP